MATVPNQDQLTPADVQEQALLWTVMLHQRMLEGVSMFFITIMTVLVFMMRLGFAFREAGMCRLKNV